jgi:cysteine desulfurase / selenocysteine lyase
MILLNSKYMNSHKGLFPWVDAHPDLIYLDSASTSLKPNTLSIGFNDYITNYGISNGRSSSQLSNLLDLKLSSINAKVSKLFGVTNFFYTGSSTDGLNTVAEMIKLNIGTDLNYAFGIDNHHAGLLPFYSNAKTKLFLDLDSDFEIEFTMVDNSIDVLVITACSNVLGNKLNFDKLQSIKTKYPDLLIVVDATQLLAHQSINFEELPVDIMVSSTHKMYGPDGVGLVFYKDRILNWKPAKVGGGIVENVTKTSTEYLDNGDQFSPGSVNAEGRFAFGASLEVLKQSYLSNPDISFQKLLGIKGLKLISDPNSKYIFTFTIEDHNPYDIATFLGLHGIIIRIGQMCAIPLLQSLGVSNCCRISLGMYNDQVDIDKLVLILNQLVNKKNQ